MPDEGAMTKSDYIDPRRFVSHIKAARETEDLFSSLYEPTDVDDSVAGLRRRRRRASNDPDTICKSVSLVEEDGVLYWRDGIPARPNARRRRRRGLDAAATGSLVLTREFPAVAPNKVVEAVAKIDRRLNPALDDSLWSRMRPLRKAAAGAFEFGPTDVRGPFNGRTLVLVHGTFSNAGNMLAEFNGTAAGRQFLGRAMQGGKSYDRVLLFEHPTLSVSPVMNALELGRALAGSGGQIDVVAHSRGGLVVRWWLEAFGNSLRTNAQVRAVLAGSPLAGTSLAAPDKIQNALSLISNIGTFAEKTLGLVGIANPFLWVASKLVEVIVSVTGALAKTPILDAVSALVPGLAGQSLVTNNHEINRLRLGPAAITPEYYAIVSNFETANPGWKFWKNFRKDRAMDVASDTIFPSDNDLVVDTSSMTSLGVKDLKLAGPSCNYHTSDTVWHCNYFRQEKSINYIASRFGIPLS
jgi:pimeloyl-ACP methyl ester carboxylesterase